MFAPVMTKLLLLTTVARTSEAYYCNWSNCNGELVEGSWCNNSENNCEQGCGGQWCTSVPPPSTPGYCSWSTCNGETQGGSWCNKNDYNCKVGCGGAWCLLNESPVSDGSPPAPPPISSFPMSVPSDSPAPPPVSVPDGSPGTMTLWTASPGVVQGSSCEIAQSASTAQGDEWLEPYIDLGNYCAVSSDLLDGGVGCSKCFRVSYGGVGGSDPGIAGSADVQVVDSGPGGSNHFDCFITSFQAITSATTGVFPITYKPIDCVDSPATVVVLDGLNAWYTKVLVAGGRMGVNEVVLWIGTSSFDITRQGSSATWYSSGLGGRTNQEVRFDIQYEDSSWVTVGGCFGGSWPVSTSSQCAEY